MSKLWVVNKKDMNLTWLYMAEFLSLLELHSQILWDHNVNHKFSCLKKFHPMTSIIQVLLSSLWGGEGVLSKCMKTTKMFVYRKDWKPNVSYLMTVRLMPLSLCFRSWILMPCASGQLLIKLSTFREEQWNIQTCAHTHSNYKWKPWVLFLG